MFIYAVIVILIISGGGSIDQFLRMIMQLLIIGVVIGVLLYAILLPFVILIVNSSFFRLPFFACLRLKGMVLTPTERQQLGPDGLAMDWSIKKDETEKWRK